MTACRAFGISLVVLFGSSCATVNNQGLRYQTKQAPMSCKAPGIEISYATGKVSMGDAGLELKNDSDAYVEVDLSSLVVVVNEQVVARLINRIDPEKRTRRRTVVSSGSTSTSTAGIYIGSIDTLSSAISNSEEEEQGYRRYYLVPPHKVLFVPIDDPVYLLYRRRSNSLTRALGGIRNSYEYGRLKDDERREYYKATQKELLGKLAGLIRSEIDGLKFSVHVSSRKANAPVWNQSCQEYSVTDSYDVAFYGGESLEIVETKYPNAKALQLGDTHTRLYRDLTEK